MSSAEVIDALFERTIDIVQSLPKTGPIQTSYEEKLALYSLYKQATEGDVKAKRPGMLDMLGRAKWDAWAKRKGYASQDAKQLYVESLLKTLRRFSDRPQAIALIEELESFSGDVAQRVMSASLARAGSDSEGSSGSLSPRIGVNRNSASQGYAESEEEEDERDLVAQLPPRPTISSKPSSSQAARGGQSVPHSRSVGGGARTPLSVEGASAMAVRGGGGPPSRMVEDSDTDEEVPSRHAALPGQTSQQLVQPRAPASNRGPQSQYARRGPPSLQQDSRLYAPPSAQRYPGPPRSESNTGGAFMTGGAGASLYSAVGPSRPTPSEQHYYHHHAPEGAGNTTRPYAASSIGGRSNPGGAATSVRAGRPDVEMALQSIQASLAAVHERLNRVETQRNGSSSMGSLLFGSRSPLGMGYQALANALHDIALLLGIASDSRGGVNGGAAPSSYQLNSSNNKRAESLTGQSTNGKRKGNVGGRGAGDGAGQGKPGISAIFRLLGAFINLSLRLALDLTSITVVFSLCLLLVRRVTGRGDPLLLFRLVRRYSSIKRGGIEQPRSIKLG